MKKIKGKIFRKYFATNIPLKTIYYRNFTLLIAIPILLIFFFSLFVTNIVIGDMAVSNIASKQDKMVTILSDDIERGALQLSHVVNVNDSELMELVAKTDVEDTDVKNFYTKEFENMLHMAMMPSQDIISCMIYMKSGVNTYVKDRFIIPKDEVIKEDWYQKALEEKNIVQVGSYDTTIKKPAESIPTKDFVLIFGISPDRLIDKSGKIEMVTIVVESNVSTMLKEQNKSEEQGLTIIVDENGEILYGSAINEDVGVLASQMDTSEEGVFKEKLATENSNTKYTYIVSDIGYTDWKMVTYVKSNSLTKFFNYIALVMLVIILILFLLFIIFSRYFLRNIISPIHSLSEGFKKVEIGNLDVNIEVRGNNEMENLITSFNNMTFRLQNTIFEKDKAKNRERESEIRALQSQINPHFLLNSLNSIKFIAQVSQYHNIIKMTNSLISILTNSFRKDIELTTVREEIELLNSYIFLMQVRYSNSFVVELNIDDSCLEYKIPSLILQPIVENAIVHGFSQTDDIGMIEVAINVDNNRICFLIKDNGKGMSNEDISILYKNMLDYENCYSEDNYNIGMKNVFQRLNLRYGEDFLFEIKSELGVGTEIIFTIGF